LKKLTPKQRKFVDEYLKLRNATQAAKNAGYSARSAYSQGERLLKKAEIATEIGRRMNIIETKTNVTVERIERELANIAFADIVGLFEVAPNGKVAIKSFNDLTEEQRRAISEIQIDGKSIKFKSWNKNSALDTLAKYKGMLKSELVNLNVNLSDLTNEQLQRLSAGEPIEKVLQG
jgi:phage terminase small subunit